MTVHSFHKAAAAAAAAMMVVVVVVVVKDYTRISGCSAAPSFAHTIRPLRHVVESASLSIFRACALNTHKCTLLMTSCTLKACEALGDACQRGANAYDPRRFE